MKNELHWMSAKKLAAEIVEGRISSVNALTAYLARVERYNSELNAVIALNVDDAMARAHEADEALARGESWGPLHGVPMTIKDSLEVVGMPTTCGAPELKDHMPERNADAVERLIQAGAIVFGKTNTPIYVGDPQTYNEIYGTTNNPWDRTRSPGGSSGGAATSLAAGMTPLELGSDIGGSVRNPAHYCGVYGHKSSYGIVPGRGHIPGPPGTLAAGDLGVLGPMARTADDLELALNTLVGPSELESVAWHIDLPAPGPRSLSDYRVAYAFEHSSCPVDVEIVSRYQELITTLRRAGARVDAVPPEAMDLDEHFSIYKKMLAASGYSNESRFGRLFKKLLALPAMFRRFKATVQVADLVEGALLDHSEWLELNEQREALRHKMALFFQDYDILLMPVVPTVAIHHQQSPPVPPPQGLVKRHLTVNGERRPYFDLFFWISTATVLYLPATVAPVGQNSEGLPFGVQILGAQYKDRTTIDFARHLEHITGGFKPPPEFID